MTLAVAPDNAILQRFLLGTLTPGEAAAVERWLEANPDASLRLRALDPHDTVIDAIGKSPDDSAVLAETSTQDDPPTRVASNLPAAVGAYRVMRHLGRGGMGVVLEAEDSHLKRRVAIKLIAAEFAGSGQARDRFLREAQAIARIDHPNVVPVHHVGEQDGQLYLVMPLLKGETLDARLKREKKLKAAEVMRIGREVAAGLAAAHAVGLIHRDIKPANIWLDADTGRARVLDFGLAKPLDERPEDEPLTSTGAVLGTLHYMSPQQANGEPLDPRTDLFSLGAVLHHAATGERPFDGPTKFAVLYAVVNDTPKNLDALREALPVRVAEVVCELLEKRPDARPKSATEVIERLTDAPALVAIPLSAPAPSPWEVLDEPDDYEDDTEVVRPRVDARPARRWKGVAVAAGMLLALVAIAATVVIIRDKNGKEVARVEVPEGGSVEIKDGKLLPVKSPAKDTAKPDASQPHKKAAEWVMTWKGEGQFRTPTGTGGFITVLPQTCNLPPSFEMTAVVIHGGKMTDAELETHLGQFDTLLSLDLAACSRVTEPKFLAKHTKLQGLRLVNTAVGDSVMEYVAALKHLNKLDLGGTAVTDAGLTRLGAAPRLSYLDVRDTKVTAPGVADLAKKLPFCKIVWDGGTVEPVASADRRAAVYVLSLGGSVCVNNEGLNYTHKVADLPAGEFELRWVRLSNPTITDAGLAVFKDCTNLKLLDLGGAAVTDDGLAHFAQCELLRSLRLSCPKVSDAGVAHFKDCLLLQELSLFQMDVTDAGMAHLAGRTNLTRLDLTATKVTDAGMIHFKDCKKLSQLNLSRTAVGDAGLAQFKDCKTLGYLYLDDTKITDAGLAYFKDCELTYLYLARTPVTGRGLAALRSGKLTNLGLTHTAVTDENLAPLAGFTSLSSLDLSNTKATDATMAHLKKCKALATLHLYGTAVSNAGLTDLAALPALVELGVRETKLTPKGATELARLMPKCRIVWDGGTIEPKK